MPILRLAALNFHELVKFKYTSLTAAVALAALVEDGYARMVGAFLALSALPLFICRAASFPATSPAIGDGKALIIGV